MNSRIVLPAITSVLGAVWVYTGLMFHGWWVEGRAQGGFFPSIVGGLLVLVSVLAIISERRADPPEFWVSHVHPLLATVGVVGMAMLIGFFPALIVYVFAWLRWYEKYSWAFTGMVTVITVGLMYGIFSMWLRVPFPEGFILQLVRG